MSALAPTMQAFFTERLQGQRQASPNTIAAYRDTFRLLLTFTVDRLAKTASEIRVDDLDAELIASFLDHLERERANSTATRNARLAAIRSLFNYAALKHPEHADTIGRVLAIPPKRGPKAARHVPIRRGDRRAAGRTGPRPLDRPTRPRAAADHRPDRTARLRADRPELRRHHAHPRPAPALPRQGPQATHHPADPADRPGPARLAPGTRRQPGRPAVPDQPRRPPQPRRRHLAAGQTRRDRDARLPIASRQADLASHAASHRRDAPATRRSRHHRHRALARPRRHQHDPRLPTRGPRPQGTRARPHAPPNTTPGRYRPPDQLVAFLESL
jgi:hypothetical protein